MFQLLPNADFDFMGKRRVSLTLSAIVCAAAVVVLVVMGLNLGIEFKGGTELQLKYASAPDVAGVRSILTGAGLSNVKVTTIGDPDDHELYIQIGLSGKDLEERDEVMQTVLGALRPPEIQEAKNDGRLNLNEIAQRELALKLFAAPGLTEEQATELAEAILERRREVALFTSHADLDGLPNLAPEVRTYLERQTVIGPYSLRSQSYIGPAIGKELMKKAMGAILGSLVGMPIYTWIRFQLKWGLAAVVALAHDALITLGLFALFGKEMSLPVVAAFLTLIGYSVNDTVVVFDRIRENLRIKGSTMDLPSLVNLSINKTLSRTIITSGLTWIAVLSLLIFGGQALSSFAFVLVVGTVVGTYSSIFIASPILVAWQTLAGRRSRSKPAARPSRSGTASRASSG